MPGLPEARSLVTLTTAQLFCIYMTEMLPRAVVGTAQAVSVKEYSPQVVEVLAKLTSALPEGFTGGFNIHTLRAESPSCSAIVPDSIVPYRTPQAIFEIAGFASEEVFTASCVEWAAELRKQLNETDAALPASYFALTAPEFIELDKIYGEERLEELRRIKSEFDPKGVLPIQYRACCRQLEKPIHISGGKMVYLFRSQWLFEVRVAVKLYRVFDDLNIYIF